MRAITIFCLLTSALAAADSGLTVHEWGTFTTVNASDGRQLSGLEVEEEALPAFVYNLAAFSPSNNKGWYGPLHGVTVKMETPVIYFYTDRPGPVRVEVGFNGGSISQWFPDRAAGEAAPPPLVASDGGRTANPPTFDFTKGYRGNAIWQVDVLPREATAAVLVPHEHETAQWPKARVSGANGVRGPKGETEGFIFYRGIGHFEPPLRVSSDAEGRVRLKNTGDQPIPFALIYEKRDATSAAMVRWHGSLEPGQHFAEQSSPGGGGALATDVLGRIFPAALIAAGLTPDEAKAMLATWHESYFDRPGLRVFWIVPRAFTDRVLPMSIAPRPAQLERVLVGRSEILTPKFEAELVREFTAKRVDQWEHDRFVFAYIERVRQLGVALPWFNP